MNLDIKVRGVVFASLQPETIEIHVGYGYGLNDGGSLWRVSRSEVPVDCQFPNTYVWVTISNRVITRIERMTNDEIDQNRLK